MVTVHSTLPAAAEPTLIESLSAWSTLGAAVATAISAAFIAWQIWLTRKSVETTEATLTVAREEFALSRLLQVEAQKAAIDAEMPRLYVRVGTTPKEARLTDTLVEDLFDSSGRSPEKIAAGYEFALPRDADVRVEVTTEVTIMNDGPRRAEIFLDAALDPRARRISHLLGADKYVHDNVRRVHTVAEWVEFAEKRAAGQVTDVTIADVIYIYPGDVSAVERHPVLQGGSILAPDPTRLGVWVLRDLAVPIDAIDAPLGTGVMPFTRDYYASRTNERRLESPSSRTSTAE
ncbi:hypothetical protein ACI3KT_11655 [Microbacterium sp. ZW T6_19]|uniref:hypothetical protein n=1 Tax=Microbacterium sp. ZW T6_19 TaxID=3378082 RepID=UPI00385535B6